MSRAARVWRRAARLRRVVLGAVPRRAVPVAVLAVMAVLPAAVVGAPPVTVAQHLVRSADLLELDGVAALAVRVVFLREPEVGGLDVFGGGARRDAEHVIQARIGRGQRAPPAATIDGGRSGEQTGPLQQPTPAQLTARAHRETVSENSPQTGS